jgi:hypothetical protein
VVLRPVDRWKAHCESCPKWEVQTICAFLKGLSALCELELDFQGNLHLPSLNLAHIKKFTFKNTAWAGVSITPSRNPTSFQEIIALITENRLVSLHLEAEGEWNQVWSLLRGKTLLTEVTTSLVTPELFAYLRSYTGLKKLTLIHPDGGSHDKSNLLADMFFETVLPQHATSLVELSCAAAYEGRFSFGTQNVDIISQMFSLTALEMSINTGRVREVGPKKMDRSNPNARRMIWIGQQVEIEQSDIDPVVVSPCLNSFRTQILTAWCAPRLCCSKLQRPFRPCVASRSCQRTQRLIAESGAGTG